MRMLANRSSDENLLGLQEPVLRGRGQPAGLTATEDVIRRFNRDTQLLTVQVIVALALAMLLFGVMVRERNVKATNLAEQDTSGSRDVLVRGNSDTADEEEGLNGDGSTGEVRPEPTVSDGFAPAGILP